MDVRLDDGTIVRNVPEGTTKAQLLAKLGKTAPNTAVDVARSIPGGLVKGAAAIAGFPRDLQSLTDAGEQWLLKKVGLATDASIARGKTGPQSVNLPGSQQIGEAAASPVGGFYQPQTTAGKYAETIASFAPAALAPGGIPARIARAVVPGAASEAAGQATEGTAYEPYARVAGAVVGGGLGAAAKATGRVAGSVANRISEAAFDTPLRDPTTQARNAIRQSIAREGGAQPIVQRVQNWQATGASNPALIDVTGNATRRLVRSAAGSPEGDAQNIAQTYADRIAGNLQDRVVGHARGLTPNETRPANVVADELKVQQKADAKANYKQPYSEPAAVTKEMVSALQGPEGRAAINRAYAAARANRDQQAMAELSDLRSVAAEQGGGVDPITGRRRSLEQALSEVSAGSLDRVRIAMRGIGSNLASGPKPANDIASGYFGRVSDIDTALDQTPGLTPARASYRDFATRREAVDIGRTGVTAPADEYGAQIGELAAVSPGARGAAGVGYRQAIVDNVQRPAEGSTGFLNRLATSNAQTQNLATTFGPQAGARFQGAVGNEVARVQNSRFINPNTGSQTEPRLAENLAVNLVTGHVRWWEHIFDTLKTSTLTAREKAELVRLGTSEAELRNIVANLPGRNPRQITQQLLLSGRLAQSNSPN